MQDNRDEHQQLIQNVVEELCQGSGHEAVIHRANHQVPMPSVDTLAAIVDKLRTVIFPGYYGAADVRPESLMFRTGAVVDEVNVQLAEQIKRGFCFVCTFADDREQKECDDRAVSLSRQFLKTLPAIRDLLRLDALAAYEGDPAAISPGETIFCYPSMQALANHRIAHELYKLDVPLIPRIIAEQAHSATGIDIHPGATIGERFFMDHGTGIVIGETSVIGRNVRLYQGVTLGAKSFPLDEDGNPIKGIARHPVVEDDVIVYAGATLLGRITIGRGSVIGGNVWVTRSIRAGTRVLQGKAEESQFTDGGGI